jgi:hypothetical protein
MDRILKAAEKPGMEPWVKAFILTMRHSGLRISDVATLATARLTGNKLYQTKTKEYVYVPLPAHVAETQDSPQASTAPLRPSMENRPWRRANNKYILT